MRSPRPVRFASLALVLGLVAGVASAAEMNISVELPKLEVAEYHRPYVAMWIEREDQSFVANMNVWYQQKRGGAGPGGGSAPGGGEVVAKAARSGSTSCARGGARTAASRRSRSTASPAQPSPLASSK